jgi:hypothetical protein
MKILLVVVALSISLLSITSCQKEVAGDIINTGDTTGIPVPNQNNPTFRVKTYTEDVTTPNGHIVVSFNLTYDSQGRVTSMTTPSGADRFVYQYNTNNSYTLDLFVSNALSIHGIFYINSIGLVDSSLQYNDTKDTSSEKYLYDANKRLLQLRQYDISNSNSILFNTSRYEYDAKGNVVKETDNTSQTTYEYNNLPNSLDMGDKYFTKNTNLTKKTTYSGSFNGTSDHTYTFDSLNRVTSEKIVTSNGEVASRIYTY